MAAAARAGLSEIGICDHGPGLLFIGLRGEEQIDAMRREVEEARARFPGVRVLLGLEANVISPAGDLDVSDQAISQLDILLVGLHPQIRPSLWKGAGPLVWNNALAALSRVAASRDGPGARARRLNTRGLVGAVRRYRVTAVTHAGLKMDVDMEELATVCAQRGTAIEINSLHGYPRVEDLELAARHGVRFIISSDAHTPGQVGRLAAGLQRAQAAGIPPQLVVNAARRGRERADVGQTG